MSNVHLGEMFLTVINPEYLLKILGVSPDKLDVSGLKLTVHSIYVFENAGFLGRSSRQLPRYKHVDPQDGVYKLGPGAYLVRYNEYVRIPEDALAIAFPRSSLLRMGATLCSAIWDPGYEGQGIGLLLVYNPHGIEIEVGAHIAQLVYIKFESRVLRPYRGAYLGERVSG